LHQSPPYAAPELAAAIAHELAQPLTSANNLLNAARRLIARAGGGEAIDGAIELLNESSTELMRTGRLIHALRVVVADLSSQRGAEDLNTLIREADTLAAARDPLGDVSVRFEFDPKVSLVSANRSQVRQVLTNLISNAREAMVAGQRGQAITIRTTQAGDGVVEVAISDTGPGLSRTVADRLYAPFVSTKPAGAGLGLAICKSIVEAHGGTLRFEPVEGGGSCFVFTLPRADGGGAGRAA
jgi:two-component system, LuxR family, sensor kinase FixL